MDRTEIFDKVLQHLYDKKDFFVTVPDYIDEITGADNYQLSISICEELTTKRNWAKPSNYHKRTMQISYDGIQIIDNYKSYSSFLSLENKSLNQNQILNSVKSTLTIIYKIGTVVFGISTVIFAYLSYIDNQEINELKKSKIENNNTISRQQTMIDSLRQLLDKQQKTIDSLTASQRTDTSTTK